MKILMVILHFPPVFRGGAELQCWKQARALAARGHEVTVLTQWLSVRTPRREMKDGVLIRRLGGLLPVTFGARKLRARLRPRVQPQPKLPSKATGAQTTRSASSLGMLGMHAPAPRPWPMSGCAGG